MAMPTTIRVGKPLCCDECSVVLPSALKEFAEWAEWAELAELTSLAGLEVLAMLLALIIGNDKIDCEVVDAMLVCVLIALVRVRVAFVALLDVIGATWDSPY